jgi:lipooligosaccharide transport system permease protein
LRRLPRWVPAFEYWLLQYRRTWRGSVLSSFVYPTLYLASMGLGLGGLVNHHLGTAPSRLGGVAYLVFVAPGVLSASAMQIGINEAAYPVMGAIRWQRTYLAMMASPLRVRDIAIGHLAWMVTRLVGTCAIFVGIAWTFGALRSPQAVIEIPAAVLTGMAFALPMAAFAARSERDDGFSTVNRLVIVPLFLFSGTFFPIAQLPRALQVIAELTPLYHGVSLCRACATGHVGSIANLGHVAYLVAMIAIGWHFVQRNYTKRLSR